MARSQKLKFVDWPVTKKIKYLEKERLLFLQMKKNSFVSRAIIWYKIITQQI